MEGYDFMKDVLDDIEEEISTVPLRKSSSKPRKSKSQTNISDKGEEKRGRKKQKIEECIQVE